ncbi:hypothetical protein KP509_17G017700 [Ceratopteris richardii]|nr:hypothetical protein KP509_17G017700 [Ceratopteris richardii]
MNAQAWLLSKQSSGANASRSPLPHKSRSTNMATSKSASALLPTPIGSAPRESSLDARLPFRVVQGNVSGLHNKNNSTKDLLDEKGGPRKKTIRKPNGFLNNSSHTDHCKDKSVPKQRRSKFVFKRGTNSHEKVKDADERSSNLHNCVVLKERADKERVDKERTKNVNTKDFSSVTILRRPKTEEAAIELFRKFFESDSKKNSKVADHQLSESYSDIENQFSEEGYSDLEISEAKAISSTPFERTIYFQSIERATEASGVFSSITTGVSVAEVEKDLATSPVHGRKKFAHGMCEDLPSWERWAGPSYINSPPPCALPVPCFSKKCSKTPVNGQSFGPISSWQHSVNFKMDAGVFASNDLNHIFGP